MDENSSEMGEISSEMDEEKVQRERKITIFLSFRWVGVWQKYISTLHSLVNI